MPLSETADLINWIQERNSNISVDISKVGLDKITPWFYDDETGVIRNERGTFFQIAGMQKKIGDKLVLEQPIILQNEIGYLGILCKDFNGEMHYLMQAKIEPGNINKVQISPTIQATKSNFTKQHGGKEPAYLDYFKNASKYKIIVDQIQSEQSARFWGKRNRNIIIEVEEEIEVVTNYRWMTLPQIKELMTIDNLVNMDTRTVLSCLPLYNIVNSKQQEFLYANLINDSTLYSSILSNNEQEELTAIYHYINNYKMFNESKCELVSLSELKSWKMKNGEMVCDNPYSFKVVFCDIAIQGREVEHWGQPLFEATGIATFGLITCIDNGVRKFLVKAIPEVGCFDKLEIGPSIQREYIHSEEKNVVDTLFEQLVESESRVIFDTLLSEEGGRFYQEQNRNIILEIDKNELSELPGGYFWTTYKTLNMLVQVNNTLNIQLRNLLAVLPW
jgi:oxidase EvaA